MAFDQDRDLRRLAKRYRVAFQPHISSDSWPSKHSETFENIRKIGSQAYKSFCANTDIRSNEQPWRGQTKHRAVWLAERSARLLNQQRNEAGWRFGLENEVLRRFAVEVAWSEVLSNLIEWRQSLITTTAQNVEQGSGDQKLKPP